MGGRGKKIVLGSWFLVLLVLGVTGCATSFDAKGRFHTVRRGETLDRIAKSYRVPLQEMAELNNIQDPKAVEPGQKIYLPEKPRKPRYKKLPINEVIASEMKRPKKERKRRKGRKSENIIEMEQGLFQWPVEGNVMSAFGIRHGRRHDGIDIKATRGTPIMAAGDGEVVFVGRMRGYGNLILVRHDGNVFTAYAHNSVNGTKKGQSVKKGDVIGKVGATGRATGPHLHFEVREGEKARNPLFFLPPIR